MTLTCLLAVLLNSLAAVNPTSRLAVDLNSPIHNSLAVFISNSLAVINLNRLLWWHKCTSGEFSEYRQQNLKKKVLADRQLVHFAEQELECWQIYRFLFFNSVSSTLLNCLHSQVMMWLPGSPSWPFWIPLKTKLFTIDCLFWWKFVCNKCMAVPEAKSYYKGCQPNKSLLFTLNKVGSSLQVFIFKKVGSFEQLIWIKRERIQKISQLHVAVCSIIWWCQGRMNNHMQEYVELIRWDKRG